MFPPFADLIDEQHLSVLLLIGRGDFDVKIPLLLKVIREIPLSLGDEIRIY